MNLQKQFINWSFVACVLFIFVGNGHAQNFDLEFSFCSPLTCQDSKFTTFGFVFVEIDGSCFNGTELQAFQQLTIIVPCTLPVSLSVKAGEEHQVQLDDCGRPFIVGGVFASGQADNGFRTTGTAFSAAGCDGGITDPPPAFNPC
ncbi:MAG TPA: hypothetical protein VGJ30_01850 [Candidatus Angelobacter sp.]